MRLLGRFSIGFAAAAALTLLLLPRWAALGAGVILLGFSLFLCRHGKRTGPILLGLGIGLLWTIGYLTLVEDRKLAPAEEPVKVTCTALDYSTESAYQLRVPAKITDGVRSAKAMVYLRYEPGLEPGDVFTLSAVLRAPEESGGADRAEGYSLVAYGKELIDLEKGEAFTLRYLPRRIARGLERSLEKSVPQDALGYAMALTTGNRTRLTTLEKRELQTAGIYHAMALSGMHLAILMGMVSVLTKKRRRLAAVGVPLIFVFAVITGGSTSILRAAVMQILILLAPLAKREEDAPTSLGAAAILLILQNPWCILGWGTQLSFGSMAGILLLGDRLYGTLWGDREYGKKWPVPIRKVWSAGVASISATLAASAGTMPLMMAYFGRISLVSPLANLLTGWAVAWCFRGSLITSLAGLISGPVSSWLGWCLAWPIRYVRLIAHVLAGIPFAALGTQALYGPAWVISVYGLAAAAWLLPGKRRLVMPVCCALTGLAACLLFTLWESSTPKFTALDVGQGQCLIWTGGGETVMVDCGGTLGEAVGDQAADHLLGMGIDRVDVLILTHFDQDHVGGVPELMERVSVTGLVIPDVEPRDDRRLLLEQAAAEKGAEVTCVSGTLHLTGKAGEIQIFPPISAGRTNDGLSLLADLGGLRVLVTGDLEGSLEQALLDRETLPKADVLVAGHHGDRESTSRRLLETVDPSAVVISVGRNNYGHPAPETLERIQASGAQIFRTDLNGNITFRPGRTEKTDHAA